MTTGTATGKISDAGQRRLGDRAFRSVALASGLLVLLILGLIAAAMISKAWPAFSKEGIGFVTTDNWSPSTNDFGALSLIFGTVVTSGIALAFAVPVSLGIALFTVELAPAPLARIVTTVVDLLAAIPSVVYGLWAALTLAPNIVHLYERISTATASIPVLNTVFGGQPQGKSFMTAGIVLAIMVIPIITSLSRDALATVPASDKAGALALGATRWEALRVAVFPKVRGALTGAVMLGLGRAMGETIAVALVVGGNHQITAHLFGSGDTLAGNIANNFGEASGTFRAALIGLGVVLFVVTIIVNGAARTVVQRADRKLHG